MQKIELHLAPAGNRILLNGRPPAANTSLARLMEYPLEILTGKLFDELRATFNGARRFTLRCAGSEAALAELSKAAEATSAAGMEIEIQPFTPAPTAAAVSRASGASSLSHPPKGPHAMQNIEIKHNPFTVKTDILVNGKPPAGNSPLSKYGEKRLQYWVEGLFDDLSQASNGVRKYHLRFTGVESDWLDIEEAAEKSRKKGMEIGLEHTPFAKSGEERLKDLMTLKDDAGGFLNLEDGDFKKTFGEALDKNFDVFVVATMSSGKSTLLNSILGQDLLPTANAATTARLAEIHCNDEMPEGVFKARCETENGQLIETVEHIDKKLLARWNSGTEEKYKDVFRIRLEGKVEGFQEREHVRLVLTDTPGPNNSQTEELRKTTMMGIQREGKQPLIVYVLNGTQFGIDDDQKLLNLVSEEMAKGGKQNKDRFLFVANKMDDYDPKKENVRSTLENVRAYLEENGIDYPLVYPISAQLAYLLRKEKAERERSNADRLTRHERGDLMKLQNSFDVDAEETRDMDMEQYMQLSGRVRQKLEDRKLPPLLRRSGIPALESLIDEYIDKYSFPYRVHRAYAALREAIRKASDKANLEKQLKLNKDELEKTRAALLDLKAKREKGFDTIAFVDKIKRTNKDLPENTRMRLLTMQQERISLERELDQYMQGQGKVSPSEARRSLKKAEDELRFLHTKMINEYENEFKRAQEEICAVLRGEYKAYVQSLFPESAGLELPVLEGIKQTLGDLSLDLDVRKEDIETEDIYKTETYTVTVSTTKWYKPWTWFDSDREVERTRQVKAGTKETVDLGERWARERGNIETAFREMLDAAQGYIKSGYSQLIETFHAFMEKEFNPRFDQIVADIEAKLSDQKRREASIAEAEKQLEIIEDFEKKLAGVLEI
jgi:ribosome biogenesis GTPase A